MKTTTVVATAVGTVCAGFLAYAAWFDYKRRTDPEFRRQLKRDIRRHVRAEKEEEEAEKTQRKDDIQRALETAKKDGFPTDVEEKEAYFLTSISQGEAFVGQGAPHLDSAMQFYKAMKVYPQPQDLLSIYDTAVPKDVLEVLAEIIALDSTLNLGGSFTKPAASSTPTSDEASTPVE